MKARRSIFSLWILIATLFLGTVLMSVAEVVLMAFQGNAVPSDLIVALFGSTFSFFYFGMLFWPAAMALAALIEFIAINSVQITMAEYRYLLIFETCLISAPFLYMATAYDAPIWYYFVAVLSVGQYIRHAYLSTRQGTDFR